MKKAFEKFHYFMRSTLDLLIAAPIRWVFFKAFGKKIQPPWWKRQNP
jgi:hypothetical protein